MTQVSVHTLPLQIRCLRILVIGSFEFVVAGGTHRSDDVPHDAGSLQRDALAIVVGIGSIVELSFAFRIAWLASLLPRATRTSAEQRRGRGDRFQVGDLPASAIVQNALQTPASHAIPFPDASVGDPDLSVVRQERSCDNRGSRGVSESAQHAPFACLFRCDRRSNRRGRPAGQR